MKHFQFILLLLLAASCSSEGVDSSNSNGINADNAPTAGSGLVTEASVANYVHLYTTLKSKAPDALERLNEHDRSVQNDAVFAPLREEIEANGMDVSSFVALSERIGIIYSLLEVNPQKMREIQDVHEGSMDEMAASIQEMLDDPDVPEAQKAELRKALARTHAGKEDLGNMWNQLEDKRGNVLNKAKSKLQNFASQSEIAAVKKHQEALEQAFSGISRPSIEGGI